MTDRLWIIKGKLHGNQFTAKLRAADYNNAMHKASGRGYVVHDCRLFESQDEEFIAACKARQYAVS